VFVEKEENAWNVYDNENHNGIKIYKYYTYQLKWRLTTLTGAPSLR
jgi:hypothetical protein